MQGAWHVAVRQAGTINDNDSNFVKGSKLDLIVSIKQANLSSSASGATVFAFGNRSHSNGSREIQLFQGAKPVTTATGNIPVQPISLQGLLQR